MADSLDGWSGTMLLAGDKTTLTTMTVYTNIDVYTDIAVRQGHDVQAGSSPLWHR